MPVRVLVWVQAMTVDDEDPRVTRAAAELRSEVDALEVLATLKIQLQLIETACNDAIHYGHAFGSELRLAQRILAILDHKL